MGAFYHHRQQDRQRDTAARRGECGCIIPARGILRGRGHCCREIKMRWRTHAWACPTTALGCLLLNWRTSRARALTYQGVLGAGTPMGQCPHRCTHKAPPVLARAPRAALLPPTPLPPLLTVGIPQGAGRSAWRINARPPPPPQYVFVATSE
ncbi:hypothetical protein BOTBODRAFT_240323 [Botryobasidium botryosum FD-172 SS1]|uniref:Uncharacterized protein n=1 Tax=Botryobasidium botryosum (strain FD-172 SS1) TaxID=930990 RepID=A0A067MY33_BOTB1|nr:hypothetical protein BOTBODRAFT_240323 [Botryobasidium botryosum FD-172 SS1]